MRRRHASPTVAPHRCTKHRAKVESAQAGPRSIRSRSSGQAKRAPLSTPHRLGPGPRRTGAAPHEVALRAAVLDLGPPRWRHTTPTVERHRTTKQVVAVARPRSDPGPDQARIRSYAAPLTTEEGPSRRTRFHEGTGCRHRAGPTPSSSSAQSGVPIASQGRSNRSCAPAGHRAAVSTAPTASTPTDSGYAAIG